MAHPLQGRRAFPVYVGSKGVKSKNENAAAVDLSNLHLVQVLHPTLPHPQPLEYPEMGE